MLKPITFAAVLSCLVTSTLVQSQNVRRFGGEAPRVSTRIAYFGPNASAGQLAIDYGQPEWKRDYETQFDELTQGKRWRLGTNFWTTLDTHLDLAIAGTEVESGYYYLVLERSEDDDWHLVLLDPKSIQAEKLDASMAEQTAGGLEAPLTWDKVDETAPMLQIKLIPDKSDLEKATLQILWGNHELTAPIKIKF